MDGESVVAGGGGGFACLWTARRTAARGMRHRNAMHLNAMRAETRGAGAWRRCLNAEASMCSLATRAFAADSPMSLRSYRGDAWTDLMHDASHCRVDKHVPV